MHRNVSRFLVFLGAALLACAPSLHAQSGSPVRGDVDGDGQVTLADARIVGDFLVGRRVPDGLNVALTGDVNGDGRVTSVDVAIITARAAGRDVSRFPIGREVPEPAMAVQCRGDVRTGAITCGSPSPAGVRGDVIVGGQNQYVKLTSSIVSNAGGVLEFDVTVQNLLRQPMGLDSVGAVVPGGIRAFFAEGPVTTGGTGMIEPIEVDGTDAFTGSAQSFYRYDTPDLGPDGILSYQETSAPQRWKLQYAPTVTTFSFLVYVSAPLMAPNGWVDIYPPAHAPSPDFVGVDTMVVGQPPLQLQDSVRNRAGNYVPGQPVTWASSGHGAATVNAASGLVTAVAEGIDSVTATSTSGRTGRVVIVVTAPDADSTTITAAPTTVAAGDTSIITVQVRDGFGRNVTFGGADVELTTTHGTLVSSTESGPSVNTDDNGNGTYTARLTGTTVGTATITGTLNAAAIGDNATVVITPAAPANMDITSTNPQNGVVGVAVASPPRVHVTDQFGNGVSGVGVTFAVLGGGGSVVDVTPVTDASGDAVVDSWTLGAGPTVNALTASATLVGGPDQDTFTAYVPPVVGNDSSQAMGNTTLPSGFVASVLLNDATINGGAVSLVPASIGELNTERGGKVTLAADGNFTYLPPAGNVLRDSVAYSIKDAHYTGPTASTAYIKFRFVGKVWYVESGSAGTHDGRDSSPFLTIAAAAAAAGVNDSILVRTGSGQTTGGTLKDGQLVYGQGSSAPFTTTLNGVGVTLLASGAAPSIGALTLGSGGVGNTLRGFTGTGGITGSTFGTLTVSEVAINNPAGTALSLATGTLSGSFTGVTSGGGTNNVVLTSVSTSGTSVLGVAGNTLSGATGNAFVVTGGTGSFTYPGSITNTAALAVNVSGKTGGAVTFSGDINPAAAAAGISVTSNSGGSVTFSGANKKISSGTAAGVTLTGNTGATVAFTNGGLTIASTTGTPFTATGGGTVEVSGAGNTISVTGAAARAVNLSGITLPAGGMNFASVSSSGTTTASAFTATSVASSGGGAFTAGSLTVAGTTGASSRGIELTTNSAPFTFTTASVGGTSAEGIYLSGNTAAVAVNGGSVATTTGDALLVSGGNAGVTVAATLTKTTAGRLVNVASRTGGTTTVSGTLSCTGTCTGIFGNANTGGTVDFTAGTKTLTTGASAAVTLTSNTGATFNFTNGGLAITTTTGAGFNATGGGTVTVGGSANTISSAGGVALNVANTTIGAGGLTFRSISANGGANGIVLDNTGNTAGLTVQGNGTAGSGGTIVNSAGANGAVAGSGVYLNSTRDVSLSWMQINDAQNFGIRGNGVVNFTMNKTRVTGANGNDATGTFNEAAVSFTGLTGTASITGSRIQGGVQDNLRVINSSGTLNRITLTGDTIGQNTSANSSNDGLFLQGTGTAVLNATVQNTYFDGAGGDLFQYDLTNTAQGDLVLSGSNFDNNHPNTASGGGGLTVTAGGGGSPTLTYAITNNTFRDPNGTAIVVSKTSGTGTATGSITGNIIGVAGAANSGSIAGSGIDIENIGAGTHTTTITGNQVRQWNNFGIYLSAGNNTAGGGQGRLTATVQSNVIAEPGSSVVSGAFVGQGIHLNAGTNSGDNAKICVTLGGAGALANSLTGTGTPAAAGGTGDIRLRERFLVTVGLPGYAGANNNNAAVLSFVQGNNGSPSGSVINNVSAGGGGYIGSCPP